MTRLLPCPFCGEAAGIGDSERGYYFVNCTACHASTNLLTAEDVKPTEAEAIEAWNTRTYIRPPKLISDVSPPPANDTMPMAAAAFRDMMLFGGDVPGAIALTVAQWAALNRLDDLLKAQGLVPREAR